MQEPDFTLDRRQAMLSLLAGLGATSALTACDGGLFSSGKSNNDAGPFYSKRQMELLTRYADTIIPTTNTPGAVAAGAPAQMESLMRHWASQERREEHHGDWDLLDETLTDLAGADATRSPNNAFLAALEAIDEAAFAEDAPASGVSPEVQAAHRRQKSFLAEVYYLSEPGATEELQYELDPAEIIPCAPLSEIGRSWAT